MISELEFWKPAVNTHVYNSRRLQGRYCTVVGKPWYSYVRNSNLIVCFLRKQAVAKISSQCKTQYSLHIVHLNPQSLLGVKVIIMQTGNDRASTINATTGGCLNFKNTDSPWYVCTIPRTGGCLNFKSSDSPLYQHVSWQLK